MRAISWNDFGVNGVGKRDAFEDLCLHLFCRRHGLTEGVSGDFNQKGLETIPVRVKGKCFGFQAKYFDNSINYTDIEDSIKKALDEHGSELDEICIYIKNDAKPHSSEPGKKIVELAAKHGVTIEWFTNTNFLVSLSQPSNLDLAQFFFGLEADFDFIKDSADYSKLTLLKSNECLNLSFSDTKGVKATAIDKDILGLKDKLVLLSGDPASGKSTAVHKLFLSYSGMDQPDEKKMLDLLIVNQAVPQIINLKHCVTDSLENIVRSRQNDFKVRGQNVSVIYLLDGLDEISEDRADLILLQISDLARKSNTKKIVVTCRTGNLNRIKLRSYFSEYHEYKIDRLAESDLYKYFVAKADTHKAKLYRKLKKVNPSLVESVTDILGLKLLWEAIGTLDENSTILDLYGIKIKRMLNDPLHYKDLNSLNLPNQKQDAILNLNEKIAYKFQEKFQFLFPVKSLQDLVASAYPKADYSSVNAIINYIGGLFFDTPDPDGASGQYAYVHRRYQEYFFIKRLQREYSKDPLVLRRLSILSNQEMMQSFFMKGLRKFYVDNNNLVGCLDLSLLDVYLGNHSGWGVDSPYYINSSSFIDALILQKDEVFNALYEDESLNLKAKIDIDLDDLEKQFQAWSEDKTDYTKEQYLINVWENGLAWLMKRVVDFWKADRKDIAKYLVGKIIGVQDISKRYDFPKSLSKERRQHIRNPYLEEYESYLFYRLCIQGHRASTIFKETVVPYLNDEDTDTSYPSRETGKQNAVNTFLRVVIDNKPDKLFGVFKSFDDYVTLKMLRLLMDRKRLKVFIKQTSLHNRIKKFVVDYSFDLNETNYHLLFYKKYFGIKLTDIELAFVEQTRRDVLNKRDVDWSMYDYETVFVVTTFILGDFSFEAEIDRAQAKELHLDYYSERVVLASLFRGLVELLSGATTLEKIYRQYVEYCKINTRDASSYGRVLRYSITELWAYLYSYSATSIEAKALLKDRLFEELHIPKYAFCLCLNKIDSKLFTSVISEDDIRGFETELATWKDDFQEKTDRYLELSLMYRIINSTKASSLFVKAIIDGTLRHGWRKDPIVHYHLVMALELLLEHRWINDKDVDPTLKQVFDLVMKAIEISDGSGTSRGPYRFVEVVSKYDRDLAAKYKTEYVESEGRRNISNSINTSIILSMVRAGLAVEEIEKELGKFYVDYDYERRPNSDSYDEKFTVYVAIAQSDLYFEDERIAALNKATELIEEMNREQVRYYLREPEYTDAKKTFIKLCKKYGVQHKLKLEPKSSYSSHHYSASNERTFVAEVAGAKSRQKLRAVYAKLSNYKNDIELTKAESWRLLIDKTYEIMGNITPFIKYMKNSNYPHTDFYTSNSNHLHFGLAHALGSPDYKTETLEYLFYNGGHEGFLNVMKAYAELGDREMCLQLFSRFLAICKLLTR